MKRNSIAFDLNKSNLGKLVLVYLSLLIAFLISSLAQASYECSLVRQLYDQLACYNQSGGAPGGALGANQPIPDNQFLISSEFGPSLCKAKQTLDPVRKELKAECETWMKERKTDLGVNYLTGTCEEKQDPCNGGLVRLTVRGLVHYSKAAVTK